MKRNALNIMAAAIVMGGLLAGCTLFDRDRNDAPTQPGSSAAALTNFYAGGAVSDQFAWSKGHEVFCVNVPTPGQYLLTYTLTSGAAYHIAFDAQQKARLYIGLLKDDVAAAVTIAPGKVRPNASALCADGPIVRYATPHIPAVAWETVFEVEGQPFAVAEDQTACPSPTAISTKK